MINDWYNQYCHNRQEVSRRLEYSAIKKERCDIGSCNFITLNKISNNTKKKDGSTPRKNSLTGSQGSSNSRENSRSRGNSKSPAKKVLSRQTSKEDQPPTKQNGETDIANGDPQGTLNSDWIILLTLKTLTLTSKILLLAGKV